MCPNLCHVLQDTHLAVSAFVFSLKLPSKKSGNDQDDDNFNFIGVFIYDRFSCLKNAHA